MQSGIAIALKFKHDHIEDSVLIYNCEECTVYLIAESKESVESFVKLSFERARCVRSACTDCSPAIGIYPKESGSSFIVELTESNWAVEAHKAYTYAGSQLKPRGRHYVVTNHDIFHEILAESFIESLVEAGSKEYEAIKYYFSK
jgi:hypothetical protein